MPLPDKVVIYDKEYATAIAANSHYDLASLDAGEKMFALEDLWVWPPYYEGAPDDLKEIQVLINGEAYPTTRLHIRALGGRNMAIPRDDRYVIKGVPLGRVSNDPLLDTSIKVLPAQRFNIRLIAGTTGTQTGPKTRVMGVGRVFKNDAELRRAYGPTYQPMGPFALSDPVNRKTTPIIDKTVPISLANAIEFSGSSQQSTPKIFPWWTWAQNKNAIPATPEYEFSYREPANVSEPFMDLRWDWTRITNKALLIRHLAAILAAGRGKCWFLQDSIRRPGLDTMFSGWVVNADYPNLLPPGTDVAHKQGPLDLKELMPQILAFNNLTEFRVVADAGTTIAATKLEMQLRGTYIEW